MVLFCSLTDIGRAWKIRVSQCTQFQLRSNRAAPCHLVSAVTRRCPEDRDGREQCHVVQEGQAQEQLDGLWIPTLAPVSRAASRKSLNTSELHFLPVKENRIYQDELFLEFKIIMCETDTYTHTHAHTHTHMHACVYARRTHTYTHTHMHFPQEQLFSIYWFGVWGDFIKHNYHESQKWTETENLLSRCNKSLSAPPHPEACVHCDYCFFQKTVSW